ncbi:MAG TPA: hypothetical protein VF753_10415 [Terriglobales bacterium]
MKKALIFNFVMVSVWACAQAAQPNSQSSMPGMDMSGHDMSNMKGMGHGTDTATPTAKDDDSGSSMSMMHSMEGHMDMGPHMKMTELGPAQPGDAERAQKVVDAARKVAQEYADYHKALADGFQIFHPEIPQGMYHFTNYKWAAEAQFEFNPEQPTSLLYAKHGDDYTLVGVMYTAPKRFTEDDLNQRIPLSVAQWHEHVNFCKPPADKTADLLSPHPQFGLRGSITTEEACDAAGGTFRPIIFNWMVHVYPFEKDQAAIWSVERQHKD